MSDESISSHGSLHGSDQDVIDGINGINFDTKQTDPSSPQFKIDPLPAIPPQDTTKTPSRSASIPLLSSLDINCGVKIEPIEPEIPEIIQNDHDGEVNIDNDLNKNDNHNHNCNRNVISIGRRKTTNKQRQRAMIKKRMEREKLFKSHLKRKKKKQRRKTGKIYCRRKRIDTNNETKLKIVKHYLKNKKQDRNFNARLCKLHFENEEEINCGSMRNINNWSRNIKLIKHNIGRFGAKKKRNRQRKSYFPLMEDRLWSLIKKENRENRKKVSNEWIRNKAMDLIKEIYPNNRDFKASLGWLYNFKQRHYS